jgi:hypothetical protein
MKQTRWVHSNHSYKSGGALEAHFGLGKQARADVKVILPSGKATDFGSLKADQLLDLDLRTAQSRPVMAQRGP